jgi:hypothetical protein
VRRATWNRLDEPERLAWETWRRVSDQVQLLSQNVAKAKDVHLVLSLEATDRVMGWLAVPTEWRARVWEGVQLLHDLHHHQERFDDLHPRLCFHHDQPLLVCDARQRPQGGPRCPRCAARWRCERCGQPFVVHVEA